MVILNIFTRSFMSIFSSIPCFHCCFQNNCFQIECMGCLFFNSKKFIFEMKRKKVLFDLNKIIWSKERSKHDNWETYKGKRGKNPYFMKTTSLIQRRSVHWSAYPSTHHEYLCCDHHLQLMLQTSLWEACLKEKILLIIGI